MQSLHLIPVEAALGKLAIDELLAVPDGGTGLGGILVAAHLHARIEAGIDLHFVFQDKVAILFLWRQKGVRATVDGGADEFEILDMVLGVPAANVEVPDVFAVEEGDIAGRGFWLRSQPGDGHKGGHCDQSTSVEENA
ncbi:MAG: hypothetical protein U5J83_15985 [Bryobacterales bacterium]|nr:hypothetical protein [Bryobacterales bacterium]